MRSRPGAGERDEDTRQGGPVQGLVALGAVPSARDPLPPTSCVRPRRPARPLPEPPELQADLVVSSHCWGGLDPPFPTDRAVGRSAWKFANYPPERT